MANRLAIITGGSRGLGLALVQAFGQQGWQLLELSRSGEAEYHLSCDLADYQSFSTDGAVAKRFSQLASQSWQQVVLIHNAAVIEPISQIASLTPEAIAEHININMVGSFSLLARFIEAFRDTPCTKNIVNISSGAAHKGYAGWALYCASKGASDQFIRALVAEEAHQSWPFSAINYEPGVVDTQMQATIRSADTQHFPDRQRFIDMAEQGALRAPEQVAGHILSLVNQPLDSQQRYSINQL